MRLIFIEDTVYKYFPFHLSPFCLPCQWASLYWVKFNVSNFLSEKINVSGLVQDGMKQFANKKEQKINGVKITLYIEVYPAI